MKRILPLFLFLSATCVQADDLHPAERERVAEALTRLVEQQKALEKEIAELKKLLGLEHELETLALLPPEKEFDERVTLRTEDGIEAFKKGDYKAAKESLQLAWEMASEHPITNYNLGLAYLRQGNGTLAKKMLKTAIEKRNSLDKEGMITAYLMGVNGEENPLSSAETKEKKRLITELTNLSNEAESYIRSTSLSLPRRMNETARVLDQMVEKGKEQKFLVQKFFMEVADRYAGLEMYEDAISTYKLYKQGMEGKVLPEDFYVKLRQVEQRAEMLEETLTGYLGNEPEQTIRHRVRRDLEELKIFASQMDRFVRETDTQDRDFKKLCDRLGEYRWGGRPSRHVLVVSRHQELLYSSLPGTLPLDRYQDTKGNHFLKNITRLADRLDFKQAEMFEVDLSVRGEPVPYLILYTFVPKHNAFIIVRMPKKDVA